MQDWTVPAPAPGPEVYARRWFAVAWLAYTVIWMAYGAPVLALLTTPHSWRDFLGLTLMYSTGWPCCLSYAFFGTPAFLATAALFQVANAARRWVFRTAALLALPAAMATPALLPLPDRPAALLAAPAGVMLALALVATDRWWRPPAPAPSPGRP